MPSQPVKLLLAVAVVSIVAASFMAERLELGEGTASPPASQTAGSPAGARSASGSWFAGWFDGMTFSREPVAPPPRQFDVRPPPPAQQAQGAGPISIPADAGGQYNAVVEIEGQPIQMLVDTGATVVALRFEDAMRLGVRPLPADFTVPLATANGQVMGARTLLREVRVENIRVSDVQAVVLPQGALGKSLLGMSFLGKLARFEIAAGRLILQP